LKNIVTRNDDVDNARFGYEIFWPGLAQVENLSPEEFEARLEIRARQVTDMMRYIQERFYMAPKRCGGLELERIDPDPPPNVNDAKHMAWRRSRLRDPSMRFIGAYELTATQEASSADSAMVGMLVLKQDEDEPEAIEIVELAVRSAYRMTGVADALLGIGLNLVHPDTIAELSVAETNIPAQKFYQKRGFFFDQAEDGGLLAERHEVFDTEHLVMSATVSTVQERMRDRHLRTRPDMLPYPVVLPESAAASYA